MAQQDEQGGQAGRESKHKIIRMTMDEWMAEGERRFGPDRWKWAFVCPVCGHVATVQDWKDVGATEGEVAFSCIGRHKGVDSFKEPGKGPCNYAGGGLFRFNPVFIDGREDGIFEFGPATNWQDSLATNRT